MNVTDSFVGNGTGAGFLSGIGGVASAFASYKLGRKSRQTAYQDTVSDMRKAGINPIYAANKGPSSGLNTPVTNPVESGIRSKLDTSKTYMENSLRQANLDAANSAADFNDAKTATERENAKTARMRNQIMEAYMPSQIKGASAADNKFLQGVRKWVAPIGDIFGGANSALDMYKTRK